MIELYCDGSSTGRANLEGGWAYIILVNGAPYHARYGGDPCTTNNLMELEGAYQGLLSLQAKPELIKGQEIVIVSDSMYTLGIANGSYTPTKNLDSAQRLRKLTLELKATTRWVKGHGDNEWNNRCDRLAKRGKDDNTPPDRLEKKKKKARKSQAKKTT